MLQANLNGIEWYCGSYTTLHPYLSPTLHVLSSLGPASAVTAEHGKHVARLLVVQHVRKPKQAQSPVRSVRSGRCILARACVLHWNSSSSRMRISMVTPAYAATRNVTASMNGACNEQSLSTCCCTCRQKLKPYSQTSAPICTQMAATLK